MSKPETILFRCDQNEFSGFGHFSRCLNLARHLAMNHNFEVSFLGNYSGFATDLLDKYEIRYSTIDEQKFENLDRNQYSDYHYILFDSYFINQEYITNISGFTAKSIFIDDTNEHNFKDIDLVINFRVGVEKFNYNSKKSALGPNYFIYKPEFLKLRTVNKEKTGLSKILLFFGGLQVVKTLVDTIIETIKEVNDKIEIYYISNDFSHLSVANRKQITELSPTFNIEKILSKVDAVINGGGLFKYECNFCKIPSASVSTTKLQYEDTLMLQDKGILFDLGFIESLTKQKLKQKVKEFLIDSKIKSDMIKMSEEIFTSDSINNILKLINNER